LGRGLAITIGTGVAALIYGILLYVESYWAGPGCCGATWPYPNPVQVERLAREADPDENDPRIQRAAALQILNARPTDVSAWLRLAYADWIANGQRSLSPEGIEALRKSYVVTMYAGAQAPWRVVFAFENWNKISPELRKEVIREVQIIKKLPPKQRQLEALTVQLQTAEGRWAAGVLGLPTTPAR
jgi:hypothetical protein